MALKFYVIITALFASGSQGAEQNAAVNPVRKVVTLLQMMQKKVTEEGEKEKGLYEKFRCYCKNGGGALEASISDAEAKIPQVGADIEAAVNDKKRTEEELKTSQTELAAAKAAMKEATAIREKEAAAFSALKADADANLFAILGRCSVQKPGGEFGAEECAKVGGEFVGALPALEKGMAGAFLQTRAADVLKQFTVKQHDL